MDIHYVRENTENARMYVTQRFRDPNVINQILALDTEWKGLETVDNKLRHLRNLITSSFRKASSMETVVINEDFTLKRLVQNLLDQQMSITILTKPQLKLVGKEVANILNCNEQRAKTILQERNDLLSKLGNILHPWVPISDNENDNKIICKVDNGVKWSGAKLLDHVSLFKRLGWVDTKMGSKIAGSRGYFLTGFAVRFNQALISYALDFLDQREYQFMQTPHFMSQEHMAQVSQLSDFEETLYKLEGYDRYLIATSEQPMTAYFSQRRFKPEELPIKLAGLSTCYRKEVGRHGQQTAGIYRVHQFEKVEQFALSDSETSWHQFEEFMQTARDFYDSLGISHRVINIVSGALNNSAAMKYDLEGWFPVSEMWGELVSCSNVTDYFSKRLHTKVDSNYAHMVNSTLCANTRVLSCLVETYQTEHGMTIPDALQSYVGKDHINFLDVKEI